METYRLKNIAIVILLLLNGGLLLLLGYQYLQAKRTESETSRQLQALCEAHQLTLNSRVDLSQTPLSPLTLSRSNETEQAIASWLLGSEAASSSRGGGIYSYDVEGGSIQFRSGGSFDGSHLSLRVDDITDFSQRFCKQFGYQDVQVQVRNLTGSVTAMEQVAGVPVYGCNVTMYFEDGLLTSVTGAHVGLEGAVVEAGRAMTCVTALVRFLDYRGTEGIVCSSVSDVQCVYTLQSTTSTLRLLPVWRIDTDTYTYFVDCSSGEITRA